MVNEFGEEAGSAAPPLQMAEAGFSLSFRMLDKNGNDTQITMRGAKSSDWTKVLVDRANFLKGATESGWQPIGGKGAGAVATAAVGATMPAHPAPAKPATAPTQAYAGNGEHVFTATKLSIQFSPQGKKLGKLHGGNFQKFGVTVWPEVAEQLGFDIEGSAPGEYPCSLRVAYAVNDQDKPQKVIGLAA